MFLLRFPLDGGKDASQVFRRMEILKSLAPEPTELIDWLNDEGLLDLDWDFPEDGDLFAAGLGSEVQARLAIALEEQYGIEPVVGGFPREDLSTPKRLAAWIASKSC